MKKNTWIITICALFVVIGVSLSLMNHDADSSSCCPGEGHAVEKNNKPHIHDETEQNHQDGQCSHDHSIIDDRETRDSDEEKTDGKADAGHEEPHHGGHDHCGSGGISDLDRSIEDLWADKCEHNILHYTCDECRYELGVVKLSDKIFSKDGQTGIVSTANPTERNMGMPLSLTGEVVTNDLKSVRVSSIVPGVVRKIKADIGRRVIKGETLFELDSTEVAEAKADYLKKAANLSLATKTAQREASLFAKKISAEVEVIEAKNKQVEAEIELAGARSRLERLGIPKKEIQSLNAGTADAVSGILPVCALIDGVVLERFASPGDQVDPGKEIMLVSDISEVWINADIKETDSSLLSLHNRKIDCDVIVPMSEGIRLPGILEAVSGKMDESTRTIRARISVKNPEWLLKPGMFVTVNLMTQAGDVVLSVPDSAVVSDEGRSFVFVHKEGDYWVRRPVETGVSFKGFTEIRQGLGKHQSVIADGSFLLKSDVLREKMGAGCAD
ncbi:MAG: efflux RND transporter periplasmic adaptor subunit [Desulfobacterales bacterium]|nr:efflux RND transporter periplasmic adaptor subunit [Desulfobacterales bacterium]